MVIVKIIGGLGNQMFQYAAGKSLAKRLGSPLKLDLSSFGSYGLRTFELERFSIRYELATSGELARYANKHPFLSAASKLLFRRDMFENPLVYKERAFHYDAGVLKISKDVYLSGYWQSERYFEVISEEIRDEFTFRQVMSGRNMRIAREISSCNAVSLHVRRGDYANNPETKSYHGLCSAVYYDAAIDHISDKVESPHYFVFSDDLDWVRTNLKLPQPVTFVDGNHGTQSYNDMRLMSLCKHNIIANSSFSWWGAWLNSNHDKIVIAPSRWFNSARHDTRDLYCPGWVVL